MNQLACEQKKVTKLEFDMSVFAFYIVVFTDTSYQANRRTISTGFSINGERLVQINRLQIFSCVTFADETSRRIYDRPADE